MESRSSYGRAATLRESKHFLYRGVFRYTGCCNRADLRCTVTASSSTTTPAYSHASCVGGEERGGSRLRERRLQGGRRQHTPSPLRLTAAPLVTWVANGKGIGDFGGGELEHPKGSSCCPVARYLPLGVWRRPEPGSPPEEAQEPSSGAAKSVGRCDPAASPSSQIFALTLPTPSLPTPSRRVGGASLHSARGLQRGACGVASPLPAPLPVLLLAAAC